jgi:hypothetical protein
LGERFSSSQGGSDCRSAFADLQTWTIIWYTSHFMLRCLMRLPSSSWTGKCRDRCRFATDPLSRRFSFVSHVLTVQLLVWSSGSPGFKIVHLNLWYI